MNARRRSCPPVIGTCAEKSKRRSRIVVGGLVATLLFGPIPVARADDADFARAKKCMNCHAIDEKRVGPPFKAVAARYANDAAAEEKLAKKIRQGGAGSWGVVPMPSNDDVTTDDAKRLARWVLMQK